jgi:hypothetical protein
LWHKGFSLIQEIRNGKSLGDLLLQLLYHAPRFAPDLARTRGAPASSLFCPVPADRATILKFVRYPVFDEDLYAPAWEFALQIDHEQKSATTTDVTSCRVFFHELNVFHKNASAYPATPHDKSRQRKGSVGTRPGSASRDEFSVIVTRNALFAGKSCLDPSNRVLRTFAEKLFHRGVATITFEKGLDEEELGVFHEIMNLDRECIRDKGGLETILADGGVRRLRLERIDYGSFSATEENELQAQDKAMTDAHSADLWDRFVHRLSSGMPTRPLQRYTEEGKLGPETLAKQINDSISGGFADTGEIFGNAVGFS